MKTYMQFIHFFNTTNSLIRNQCNTFFIAVLLGLSSLLSYGQTKQETSVGQFFLSGPKGTVIQFIFDDNYIKTLKFDPTEKVMVYKKVGKNKKRTLLQEVSFPSSAEDFSTRLGSENTQELMVNLRSSNTEELYQKVRTQPVDSLGLNLFSIELQKALGLAYIDDSWKSGEVSHYEIEKVNAQGEVLQRMSHTVDGISMRYPYKFRLSEEAMTDTIALLTWSSAESVKFKGAFPVFSKLMQKSDLEVDYQEVGRGIVSLSASGDSSHVYYRHAIERGEAYSFYSVLYDWAGNQSEPSDTTYTLSVSAEDIAFITEFRAHVETDAIALSWKPLKRSALYTGIEISKSRIRDSDYTVLDTVNSQEMKYQDRKILPGSAYYYRIRPLLLVDNPTVASEFSETSAAVLYRPDHTAPAKPDGLRLATHEEGIKLSWWAPNEMDIFGYYVLRGVDPQKMERIGQLVQDTAFVDKDFPTGFSGDLNYALLAINQNQQLSDTSDIIAFGIRQQVALTPPAGLAIYQGEESLSMRWNDVKVVDSRVCNYLLLRRKIGEEKYDLVKIEDKLDVPFYSYSVPDSEQGVIYEYAVASQDIWGNYSVPSNPVVIHSNTTRKVNPPNEVYLRSLSSGIEISWPIPYEVGEETYIIYRKADGEQEFKEIAKVQPNTMKYYLDDTAVSGLLYDYAISISKEKLEGAKSSSSSIRR